MEFMLFLILALFSVGRSQECSEERFNACSENTEDSGIETFTEEDRCGALKSSIDCLRKAADDCLDDEKEYIELHLQFIEQTHKETCGEDATENCLQANEDYLYECIYEGSNQALYQLIEEGGDPEGSEFRCSTYRLITSCFVERIGEKCGDDAARLARLKFDDPSELAAACESVDLPSFDLFDKKKK